MEFIVENARETDAGAIARLWCDEDDGGAHEQMLRTAVADPETLVAVARNGRVVGACVGQIQELPRVEGKKVGVLWRLYAQDDAPDVLSHLNDYAVSWMRSRKADVVRLNEPASSRTVTLSTLGYTSFADVVALKLT